MLRFFATFLMAARVQMFALPAKVRIKPTRSLTFTHHRHRGQAHFYNSNILCEQSNVVVVLQGDQPTIDPAAVRATLLPLIQIKNVILQRLQQFDV
ncbi:hypothetical protein ACYZUC_03695 [Pseudomonas sp. GT1P32]